MFHLAAYSQSQDQGGVLLPVAPVIDQSLRIQGNDIIVPDTMNQLFGAGAMIGTTGERAQLISPSLRTTQPYDIRPVDLLLIPTGYNPMYLHESSPLTLDVNEGLDCNVLANPAAAEQQTVLVWLGDGKLSPKNGYIIKTRFTITVAQLAGAWNNTTITFPDALPVGNYSCVGAALIAAGAVAFRFVPVGGKWRPGAPCSQTISDKQDEKFRNGALGEWFQFSQIQPPSVDIIGSAAAASATYTGVMDLIAL